MTEQRNSTQVNELSHNQAMLILATERRELLAGRNQVAELQQLARQQVVALEKSNARIVELEAERAEAKAATKQPKAVPKSKDGKS